MKKITIPLLACFMAFTTLAQPAGIDEEKVVKAVALMKKMMTSPGEMQAIYGDLQALKLNSAERKEAEKRTQQQALQGAAAVKDAAMKTGSITEQKVSAWKEDRERIVPVKDNARINSMLKRNLGDAEIKNFCKAVHDAVKSKLDPAVIAQAEKIYTRLQAATNTATGRGNGAISCYLAKLPLQGIYILGRVCSEENTDGNNLNNYAALLSGYGAEQVAIPVLNYLNRKYARSPVVLSNLAVAWMGLGDLKTAEKYADSCIRFFPGHAAQAHYVKSVVKESEGDREAAKAELAESISKNYSAEKESMLKKMGGRLTAHDIKKNVPADALGLSKFTFPKFPSGYDEAISSSAEWKAFYTNIDESIKIWESKAAKLRNAVAAGNPASAAVYQNQGWRNFYERLNEEYAAKDEEMLNESRKLEKKNSELKDALDASVKKLNKQFEHDAQGQQFSDNEACTAYKSAYDVYMGAANPLHEKYYTGFISFMRKYTNELVYAGKHWMDDAFYEAFAADAKLKFLYALRSVRYKMPEYTPMLGGFGPVCSQQKPNPFKNKGLAKWEEVHCPPDWEMKTFGSSVSTHCNNIKLEIDLGFIQGSYTENLITGEWVNTTLEVGRKIGSQDIGGIEAGAEVCGFIEIDKRGISDAGVKGKAELDATVVSAGEEVKISVMTGKSSAETKAGTAFDKIIVPIKANYKTVYGD
ncbi:MAG: hypothetical protein U0V75_15915 [Ferruginibacter sp.]